MSEREQEIREQLAEIDRQFPGVTSSLVMMDADEMVAQIRANDSAVFIGARDFAYSTMSEGGDVMPSCEIECDWIEEKVAAGEVTCAEHGVASQIGASPETLVDLPHPTGFFRLSICPLYVSFEGAPAEWIEAALDGFRVLFPAREGGKCVFISTGPMTRYSTPKWMSPYQGAARNAVCPCGSGLKFKRCHGR